MTLGRCVPRPRGTSTPSSWTVWPRKVSSCWVALSLGAVGDNRVDITLDDGGTSSLWWATKNEWLGLLDVAGLQVEALYGGFAGEPFDEDSREYVFVARR